MRYVVFALCLLLSGCITLPELPGIRPAPEPVEKPAAVDHGRLVIWHVPGDKDNGGKRVEVYETGYEEPMAASVTRAVDGLTDWYADEAHRQGWGDETSDKVRDAEPVSITCEPLTYLPFAGAYADTWEPARVPDAVLWKILLTSGRMEFTMLASADTVKHGAMHMEDDAGRRLSNQTVNDHLVEQHLYNGKVYRIR